LPLQLRSAPQGLQVSSVLSVVGFGGKPCPIPDHDIHTIQAVVGSGLPVSPWPFLRIGQRVRVTEGALAGWKVSSPARNPATA